MHHSTYGSDRYSQSDHIICWPSGRSTTGGGGGWYFGCTSLLGNLLRYVLLCVCVVCSVAVSCDPICSRNTEFIVCLLWSFSTSSKRASHPLHTIPYIVLYLRASYTSKRTVYHFSRKKGCSLKIVFLHVEWYAKLQSWKSSRLFSYSSSEISQFLYVLH